MKKFEPYALTDMEIALMLLREMKTGSLQAHDEDNHEVSESFLKHAEKTAELLENPFARSLLREAIKEIRASKTKHPDQNGES